MKEYIKRPVRVKAMKWDDDSFEKLSAEHQQKILPKYGAGSRGSLSKKYFIKTLEGLMRISNGDYLIEGVEGELYPCKARIFEKTYVGVDDGGGVDNQMTKKAVKDGL